MSQPDPVSTPTEQEWEAFAADPHDLQFISEETAVAAYEAYQRLVDAGLGEEEAIDVLHRRASGGTL